MPRIAIIGAPGRGKTTYATKLARELGVHLASTGKRTETPGGLVSTDNYLDRGTYADLPDRVIADLRKRDSFVLEGTQAARVVRRWLREAPDEVKLDKVCGFFGRPWVSRGPRAEATAKGVRTTLRELLPMLEKAGIPFEHMTPPEMTEDDWREHCAEKMAEAARKDREDEQAPQAAPETPPAPVLTEVVEPVDPPAGVVQDT